MTRTFHIMMSASARNYCRRALCWRTGEDYARPAPCVASIFDKDYQKFDKERNSACIASPAMLKGGPMKKFRLIRNLGLIPAFLLLAVFLTSRWVSRADEPANAAGKIRVLIVTGGHPFDPDAFFAIFRNNPDITYRWVEHPKAQAWFKAEAAQQYDVVLAYDNYQEISEEAKADFVNLIKGGKGLVVVHHGIGSYLDWPEYWKIMGMRWYHTNTMVDGVVKFSYPSDSDDNHFRVHVVDPEHPVTRGMKDYDMIDETYKAFDVYAGSQPLLTTDCPISNKVIAWAKTYGEGRVVCIQSGHGPNAYVNPNFQTFLRQAIQWTAKKS
jgi:hypothetical protein